MADVNRGDFEAQQLNHGSSNERLSLVGATEGVDNPVQLMKQMQPANSDVAALGFPNIPMPASIDDVDIDDYDRIQGDWENRMHSAYVPPALRA